MAEEGVAGEGIKMGGTPLVTKENMQPKVEEETCMNVVE